MNPLRGLAATGLAAGLLLSGCAADRVAGMRPATAQQARHITPGETPACRFTVKAIDDQRDHKGLGSVVATVVDGEGFADWFRSGIESMPGFTRGDAPVEVRIDVLKAYIHSLSTLKSANLVVRVQATTRGAPPQVKMYRGVDGSTNWSSSESEIQAAFDRARSDLERQIGSDLAARCAP